jgi:photosystem II stability/assembly factor-like uncharacterized protein
MPNRLSFFLVALSGCIALACSDERPHEPHAPLSWSWVAKSDAAALLSVHGSSASDVWIAGADDGLGPVVLHFDGAAWERKSTGVRGDLWWAHATDGGPVFFAGQSALVLRYQGGAFERLDTPGLGKDTIYGLWAAGPNELYAVGSSAGRDGFIWHYQGERFESVALPAELPVNADHDQPGLFKVWGTSKRDVWVSGASGTLLQGNAEDGFKVVQSSGDDILFTVHARGDHVVAVGGTSSARLLESRGGVLSDRSPASTPLLQGAWIAGNDEVWAVGVGGTILRSGANGYEPQDPGLDFSAAQSLHSVWVDPGGGVWAVGGNVLTAKLDAGVALHAGPSVPKFDVAPPPIVAAECPRAQIDPAPTGSMARRWNEQILGAIRRDVPRPGVHSRNLFHLSVAMWDAFVAFDDTLSGYLVHEHDSADDVAAARDEAVSYAAYRVLSHRYAKAVGGAISQACFDAFMQALAYDPSDTTSEGSSPRAVGNRIGQAVIDGFADDGANEAQDYADPSGFEPSSPNLVVDRPGSHATDPRIWQRLVLAKSETQNGIPGNAGAQAYVCAQWGDVTPFALERSAAGEPYLDLGTAPTALDDALVAQAVDLISRSAMLDSNEDELIDVSPGALGNNPLGTNAGAGRSENPVTGAPYTPHRVKRSDFARVLAEFWADGPNSETPPGHWNVLANAVADDATFERRLYGNGDALDPLAWDVRVYLALNGALHDAAIAAWELKRKYVTARPITLIRYMAEHGQRTDPEAPSYNPEGLPLVEGLIELITSESSAPGERHAHLARHLGQIAVRSWRGEPGDRTRGVGGVGYILGVEWMPYQRRTFVTPAFPGYASGHSTFSRAAATVLAEITGSEFFPSGLASRSFAPGYLFFEQGPSAPMQLEWATYYDAADQAGQSRLWGGIHIASDDLDGRRIGARVGEAALARAHELFASRALRKGDRL